ncbi:hypothetical protein ACFLRM_06330, partial [Acidobacteriota bacterium]
MRIKLVSFAIIILLLPSIIQAEKFDIQVSYGIWTLSPFTTIIEHESEDLIKQEFLEIVRPFLPEDIFSTFQSRVD